MRVTCACVVCRDIADAPKVTVAPRDQRVADNGIVSFFCKASGNPAPEVYWRKGGRRVATGRQRYSTLNMPHGSVLRIEPVKASRDHDDAVECVADNGVGEAATSTAQLDIYHEGQSEFCSRQCSITLHIGHYFHVEPTCFPAGTSL